MLSPIFATFLFIAQTTLAWDNSIFFPTGCQNFTDTRTVKPVDHRNENWTLITIPVHLTSKEEGEIQFIFDHHGLFNEYLNARQHEAQCSSVDQRIIKLNLTKSQSNQNVAIVPPSIILPSSIQDGRTDQRSVYFTVDGYMFKNGEFYSPDEYCVLSVSDHDLVLKTCKVDCSADLSKTFLYSSTPDYSTSRVCIPKCCGVDETLVSTTSLKCKKLSDTEPFYFIPYLRLQNPIWFLKDSKDSEKDKYSTLASPSRVTDRRQSFNESHAFGSSRTIWNMLHFYSPGSITCKKGYITESIKLNDVKGDTKGFRRPFRLLVEPDNVHPEYLSRSRTWRQHLEDGGQFCVDGVDKWGVDTFGDAVVQVVVMCGDPIPDADTRIANFTPVSLEDWVHLGFSIFATLLMLLTFLIFVGLFKSLDSQELLILSHCSSLCGLYITATLGRLYYLTTGSEKSTAGNSLIGTFGKSGDILMAEEENIRIGTGCTILAILHHYFQYTTYFWLTVMNYDIWKRVRLLKFAEQRNISEIMTYSAISWGIPAIFIISYVIADQYNNDPFLEVIMPDYGKEYCTVASWSAGYYVHLPILILLLLNCIFILNRMEKWCRKKCIEDAGDEEFAMKSILRRNPQSSASNEPEKPTFPPVLFGIIWCIHLLAWLFELSYWLKLFKNNYQVTWQSIVTQYFSLLIVPFLLFYLYCMNEDVVKRLGTNFQSLSGVTNALQKSKLIMKVGFMKKDQTASGGNDANASGSPPAQNDNDAVVIDSGN